jgi:hypothetical protein
VAQAANSFTTYPVIGEELKENNPYFASKSKSFRGEMNGRYRFKAAFIPKGKGDFGISPGNAASVFRNQDKCAKADFSIAVTNTNQHRYIYQESRPGYEITEQERTNVYSSTGKVIFYR